MRPLLVAAGGKKDFGYKQILKEVSFGLSKGDATLLLGKNGAGKSTLLKIMSGLMRPTGGAVHFEGKPVIEDPDGLRRALGVIGHHPQVYGDLSAKENLIFAARLRHVADLEEQVEKALVQVGLERFKNAQVKNFSSGMFKRLAIAKLMVTAPRVLLLDEPYTGLDYKSVEFFNEYLTQFKQGGGAILLVSHQLDCCFELAGKIAILEQGVIDQEHQRSDFEYQELVEHYQRSTQ